MTEHLMSFATSRRGLRASSHKTGVDRIDSRVIRISSTVNWNIDVWFADDLNVEGGCEAICWP